MRDCRRAVHAGAEGFALILAILALMLLTTLGITLSLTTTTEVQIASNYKWSQQALYNAEAGLEAGKVLLSRMDWELVLPFPRANPLPAGNYPPGVPIAGAQRNFENGSCDTFGSGLGYGVVLSDGLVYDGRRHQQNVTSVLGQQMNGAYTIWVRRPVVVNQDGTSSDAEDDGTLVMTVEGTAPFSGDQAGSAFVQANRAVRILEAVVSRQPLDDSSCGDDAPQKGEGSSGDNFTCRRLGGAGTGLGTGDGRDLDPTQG